MAIKTSMVKELRELTGAGMMDCKKALTETDGDMDAAVEYLRKNGIMKAQKKESRIAAEGLVTVAFADEKTAAIVEVNSETDFVAKNEKFQTFVRAVADQAAKSDASDMDAFMAEKWNADESQTVNDVLVGEVATIGEKLTIRRFERVKAGSNEMLVSYIHGGGRIGVIVKAEAEVQNDAVKEALTNVAMQVAAMRPKYLSADDVSEEYKNHEKEVLLTQAKTENPDKPDNIIEKMIIGRLNKELKEVCLLDQPYIRAEDGKQTVQKYLDQVSKEVGGKVNVVSYVRYETGEGLEKRSEDFAAEVAAQIGQ